MAKGKSLEQMTNDYLHDPRWKKVNELCKFAKFEKANTLANKIIDSYPFYVRQNAVNVEFKPDYIQAGFHS